MKRSGKRWQETEKDLGNVEEIGDFSSAHSYKTETMEEEAVGMRPRESLESHI
jgi:hypothetical protein